jgi:copper chaperone CopZ
LSDQPKASITRATFSVRNISCATCARVIEKRLRKVDGVKNVGAAIMLNKVFVDYEESKVDRSEIMKAIERAGYSNYLVRETKQE